MVKIRSGFEELKPAKVTKKVKKLDDKNSEAEPSSKASITPFKTSKIARVDGNN